MRSLFQQISRQQVRSGLGQPMLMLRQGVDQLEHRFKLRFRSVADDLDEMRIAWIETSGHFQFALTEHKNAPEHGVVVNASERGIELGVAWRVLAQALNVHREDLKWAHPHVLAAISEDAAKAHKFAGDRRAAGLPGTFEDVEHYKDTLTNIGPSLLTDLTDETSLPKATPDGG